MAERSKQSSDDGLVAAKAPSPDDDRWRDRPTMAGVAAAQFVTVFDPHGKRKLFPMGEEVKIGRAEDNDILLDDPFASRHHCRLVTRKGRLKIVDRASKHGTFVDGRRVMECDVTEDSLIRVGGYVLQVGIHSSLREAVDPPKRSPRWAWGAAAGLLVTAAAVGGHLWKNAPIPVRTVKSELGKVPFRVSVTGTFEAQDVRSLTAGVSGTIQTVLAKPGMTISKGDAPIRLESGMSPEEREKREARLLELERAAAEAGRVEVLRSQAERTSRAFEEKRVLAGISKKGVPLATADEVAEAQRRMTQARTAFEAAQAREAEIQELKKTPSGRDVVLATEAGRIVEMPLAAGMTLTPDTVVAKLASEEGFLFSADFPLESRFLPSNETEVKMEFPGTPSTSCRGVVLVSGTGRFSVRMRPPLPRSLGTQECVLEMPEQEALLVPEEALTPPMHERAKERYVWIAQIQDGVNGVLHRRTVTAGEPIRGNVPLFSGVLPEDILVLPGSTTFSDWQKIKIAGRD